LYQVSGEAEEVKSRLSSSECEVPIQDRPRLVPGPEEEVSFCCCAEAGLVRARARRLMGWRERWGFGDE